MKLLDWFKRPKNAEVVKEELTPAQTKLEHNAFIVSLNNPLSKQMEDVYRLPTYPPSKEYSALYEASTQSARVYIYNIAPFKYVKEHSIFKYIVIPDCQPGKPYELAFSLPELMVLFRVNIDNNGTEAYPQNGKRVAMDIINPDNFGLDQNKEVQGSSDGSDNLSKRGVFWSMNNPPTEEELTAAKKRLRKHYKQVLEKASVKSVLFSEYLRKKLENKDFARKELFEQAVSNAAQEAGFTPEEHAAADYLRVKTQWHPVLEEKHKTQEKKK